MTKISSLTTLTGAGVDTAADLLPIVDMSASGLARNKKITVGELGTALGVGGSIPSSYLDTDGTLAANSDAKIASQKAIVTYVAARIAALVNAAPGALDTLKELADAIGDDANYAATVTTALAGKQPLDSDLTAIAALATTTFGRSLLTAADAAAVRAAIGAGTGSGAGDLVSTNNLSDVASAATSRTNLGATTIGASLFTLTNPSAITFPRYNADNSVSALSASAFRSAIGAGTGTGDLVSTNNLSDLASAATARTNLGLLRLVSFFFTTTPTASEVLALYVAADAFTLPANLSGSKVNVGTNATATFALDLQQNGTTIGTISIATSGTATLTTTSGTAKSVAVGDVLKAVAPATPDTTIANVAINIKGTL